MARSVDKEILIGFIDEVKAYLPVIKNGIEAVALDPARLDALHEAHRHIHTIKGASSMIGFSGLSHIAFCIEETIEDLVSGRLTVSQEALEFLAETVSQIELFLDNVFMGGWDERQMVAEVTQARQLLIGEQLVAPNGSEPAAPALDQSLPTPKETSPSAPAEEQPAPMGEEVSPELMEVFLVEAEDHLQNIAKSLRTFQDDPDRKDVMQEVRRSVHTLKGAGAMVGFRTVTQLSHRMEDLLDLIYEGRLSLTPDVMELLFTSADVLQDLVNGTIELPLLNSLYSRFSILSENATSESEQLGELLKLSERGELPKEPLPPEFAELADELEQAAQQKTRPSDEARPAERRKPSQVVRVPLDRLDEVVRLVSELAISRTTFEQLMLDYKRLVDELIPSTERLRRLSNTIQSQYEVSSLDGRRVIGGLAGIPLTQTGNRFAREFDSLEFDRYTEFHRLSRELIETTSDIRTVGNDLNTLVGDFDTILNRQGRISSDIQERLMRTRMVPLATLATRLHRTVRVLANEQKKQVDFSIDGEQIELDKTVLEEIADPLNHLLRNAVDHGIEPLALRKVLGKPETGRIRLRAYYAGNQVIIEVSDDGAGLEPQILRATALKKGYVSETEIAQLSDDELYSLVFLPGFSTSTKVSEVSGRGVGLDVVRTNVHKLKGSVSLSSKPGAGVKFTIRLPMTLAITRSLLVKAHGETFAFPLGDVTQILRLESSQFERIGKETVVRVGNTVYPLIRLGEVLHLKQPADETVSRLPVLVFNAGEKQYALVVDHILQGREIVIKSLGNHLRRVTGISGATLMGDGSVVLILNPLELVSMPEVHEPKPWKAPQMPKSAASEAYSVMIVDDSPSVRRVISNLVKNTGWVPVVAKDGVDALETIQSDPVLPDLILLDIEMPRMDGYEFMQTLRAQSEYQSIPIIILTSRAGEKHRQKAIELGARDYVVKPYQDEVLVSTIRKHILATRRAVPA
jgi:chemosensory pili system protein ChpA (sensor histidine kinase/response regulator)